MKTILALFWVMIVLCGAANGADLEVGMSVLDLGVLETGRPSKLNIWFPQGACPDGALTLCLAAPAITNKIVVFSHGSMGSADNYSWFGKGLAAKGFIVVGMNHYGESRIYGQDTQDPRSTALTWQRAQDVSAVLTRLATEKVFQRPVNWENVVAIGHSAGGQTTSLLAGARYSMRQLVDHCNSAAGKEDLSCNYGRDRARASQQFIELFNANYQDARIKKIVLLDPALGSAVLTDSLRNISLPSLFAGAVHNDFLPWDSHGSRYASSIPSAQTILLNGQEGHFTFLSPCQHDAAVMGISLCKDKPGVDRNAVHQAMMLQIIEFVRADSEPSTVMRLEGQRPPAGARYVQANTIVEILTHTPRWVFALLAGLVVLGLMQVRTRQVPVWLALLLPVGMLVLSVSGILLYVGLSAPALASWLLGIATVAALYLSQAGDHLARYDADSRKIIIAGSWSPMLVILAIFGVRYMLGVANALEFTILQDWRAKLLISLLLGGFSGYFLARGFIFWRTQSAQHPA